MLKQAILVFLAILTNAVAVKSYYQDEANLKQALLSDFTADESRNAVERQEFIERYEISDDLLRKSLMDIYQETTGKRSLLASPSRERMERRRILEGVLVWLALCPDARTKPFFLEFATTSNEHGFLRAIAVSSYLRVADAEEAKEALLRFLVGSEKMEGMTRLLLYQYAQMAWHGADSMEKKAAILAALYVALSSELSPWVFRVGDQIVREMSPRYATSGERLALLERALAHPFPERRERTKRELESRLEEMRKLKFHTSVNTNLAALKEREFNQPLPNQERIAFETPPDAPGAAGTAQRSGTGGVDRPLRDRRRGDGGLGRGRRMGVQAAERGIPSMTRNSESSAGGHADWIEWRYEGVVEAPGGGLEETHFTVRTVWTAVDLQAAPVRLEPVTAAANEAGTVVNPAGVAVNSVAVYRVDAVPAGIVPDEAIANVATGLLSTLRWGLPL